MDKDERGRAATLDCDNQPPCAHGLLAMQCRTTIGLPPHAVRGWYFSFWGTKSRGLDLDQVAIGHRWLECVPWKRKTQDGQPLLDKQRRRGIIPPLFPKRDRRFLFCSISIEVFDAIAHRLPPCRRKAKQMRAAEQAFWSVLLSFRWRFFWHSTHCRSTARLLFQLSFQPGQRILPL